VLANLNAKELEAAKAKVKQAMGPLFQGEDTLVFQATLRAKVLEWQRNRRRAEAVGA
jgi:hypothetical protein